MKHLGDYDTSTVVYGKFTTYRPSTGATYTLAGTPALSVYKDNSTTQSTTGVTLTADFDSVTGFNHYAIDTSADGAFYTAGSFFDVVITTGTVDGVSVTGAVVGSFTLRKNSALKPTTAGRTLDVSAGGEAGLDWANVGSPTTVVGLSGTTIKTATDVETDTADIQTRLPAALVSGRIDASVGAMAANTLTASALAADAGAEIADAVWDESISGHQTAGSTGRAVTLAGTPLSETTAAGVPTTTTLPLTAGSATDDFYNDLILLPVSGTLAGQARIITDYDGATKTITVDEPWTSAISAGDAVVVLPRHVHTKGQIADAVWDESQSGHTTAGTFGKYLDAQVANVEADTQDIQSRIPAALVSGRIDASVGAMAANTLTASALAADAGNEIADAILNRDMSAVSDTNDRSPLNALRAIRNKIDTTGGTLTVKKEDDSTTAWTATLTTSASADPITAVDPA